MSKPNSTVEITALGALGDGIAHLDGQTVFVAGALPGETVLVGGTPPHLKIENVEKPSAGRQEPACRHFSTCGGCVVQHADARTVLAWKRSIVEDAFRKEGLVPEIEDCVAHDPHSRRRVVFSIEPKDGDLVLGFNAKGSHELTDIAECPILLPGLEKALPALRELSKSMLRSQGRLQVLVTHCDNGIDLDYRCETEPSEDMVASFVRLFSRSPFIRASVNGDVIAERERPFVSFGAARVSPPAGGFLQAVADAEQSMSEIVCHHLKKAKRVADLFCGSGAFSLRLAEQSRVHAVEMEQKALEALSTATGTGGLKSITTQQRDLHQLPLTAHELKPFDGVCLDPPRAGALEQVEELARATAARVAYVSCNPTTLARDAKVLIAGGFELQKVIPIDQFVWSHHVEAVALFARPRSKPQRSIFGRR